MTSNPPVVARARKSLTRLNSIHSSRSSDSPANQDSSRQELVHVAEVHDSKTRLLVSSEEEDTTDTRERPRRRPKTASSDGSKRRFRLPQKGNETDTLSEVESGSEEPRKQYRAPRKGSATDTLSEASDTQLKQSEPSLLVPQPAIRHRAPRRGSVTDTLSEESSDDRRKTVTEKPPVPAPRLSIDTTLDSRELDVLSEEMVPVEPMVHSGQTDLVPPPTCTGETPSNNLEHSQECLPLTSPSPDEYPLKVSSTDSLLPPPPPHRLKRFKKKKKSVDDTVSRELASEDEIRTDSELQSEMHSELQSELLSELKQPLEDCKEWVCVTVHGCDPLKFMDFCSSPAVRLHVVDPVSGSYLHSRTRAGEPVSPLETRPFSLKLHRTVTPRWEEDLILREPVSLVASKESLLLLEVFESSGKGRVVAWAFLKLVASNGASNTGRLLRLQLFKANRASAKKKADTPKCYQWWSKGKYSLYKSTLYITVTPVPASEVQPPTSPSATSQDASHTPNEQHSGEERESGVVSEEEVVWSRYPGQSCKLPNGLLAEVDCGRDGALCLRFSHSGRLLAAPTHASILIYTVPSARLYLSLTNHQGIVYDMAWSENDEFLVSASADSTACIWSIKKKLTSPLKVLAHPSYVYCCCWVNSEAVTGCFDGHIRIWKMDSETPTEYLTRHRARVNTVSCHVETLEDQDDNLTLENWTLASGDSSGIIVLWRKTHEASNFDMVKEIKLRELMGQIINRLLLVNEGKRLLVQTRDSLIRLVDLTTAAVLQWYEGGVSMKVMGSLEVCGCGRRVWSSSEDGALCVWDFATGARLALYSLSKARSDSTIALTLHPLDHIAAYVSHLPNQHPTLTIITYNKEKDGSEVGLIILDPYGHTVSGTGSKWSSIGTPLYSVPSVKIDPPAGLAQATPRTSRKAKARSPLAAAPPTRPFSGERTTKSLASLIPRYSNRSPDTKVASDCEKEQERRGSKEQERRESREPKEQERRETRICDIIEKMDMILLQASPKQVPAV